MPSNTAFTPGDAFTILRAAKIPKKKEKIVATIPVFNEIHNGLQSNVLMTSITASMFFSFLTGIRYPQMPSFF